MFRLVKARSVIHRAPKKAFRANAKIIGQKQRSYCTESILLDEDVENGARLVKVDENDNKVPVYDEQVKPEYTLSFIDKPEEKPLNDAVFLGWIKKEPPLNRSQTVYQIEPTNFLENKKFLTTLQKVLSEHVYDAPGIQGLANEVKTGWMNIPDLRTVTGSTIRTAGLAAEDILGIVQLNEGEMVKGSYKPMDIYRTVTPKGLVQLDNYLHDKLLEELERIQTTA